MLGTSGVPATFPSHGDADLGQHYVGRRYTKLILILGTLTLLGPLTIDTYLPAFPVLATELRTGHSQVQLTLMAFLIGLAVGQLIVGPITDAIGRRRPIMAGLSVHIAASVLCAFAPTVELLTAARLIQGLGGAAVSVTCMAIVRDLFSGKRAAVVLSRLILVMGVGPVIAPALGSLMLKLTSWRGIFGILAVVGVLALLLTWRLVPETLPHRRRARLDLRSTRTSYAILLRDKTFLACALGGGMIFGCLFAYVGGSSTILQEVYGLSADAFAILFGGISLGFTVVSQINSVLIRRWNPAQVLQVIVGGLLLSAVAMVILVRLDVGVLGYVIPAFCLMVCCGLSMPNATAVALQPYGERAGTAAAVLGATQFIVGALASVLVGVFFDGTANAVPTVALIGASLAAALIFSVRRVTLARDYD